MSNLLNNERSADIDRVRLVMLYALRFERESPQSVEQLISRLAAKTSKHKAGVWIMEDRPCFFVSLDSQDVSVKICEGEILIISSCLCS